MKLSLKKLAKKNLSSYVSLTAATAIVVVGTLFSAASLANADSLKTGNWTQVGSVTVPSPTTTQTVTAYACNDQVSSTLWKVKARFTLSYSYKTVNGFGWTAGITNTGSDPIKNYQSVSASFKDTVHPHVGLKIETYPPVSSPLTFSYAAGSPSLGTTASGNIAQNVLPQNLVACSD